MSAMQNRDLPYIIAEDEYIGTQYAADQECDRKEQGWQEAFKREHPNACVTCWGGGHVATYQTHAPGMTETIYEYCSDCVEKGKCPVCGGDLNVDASQYIDLFFCKNCGFKD
jgi:DnaJ-class molecular chaperone